jgi:hypothetical protein
MPTCKRCGYETNRMNNLIKHLQRKKPCPPIIDTIECNDILEDIFKERQGEKVNVIACQFCNAIFTQRPNKYRHQKICKKNPVNQVNGVLLEKIESMQKTIDNLQNGNITSMNIGTINNIQQNNVTINLKSFGYENISHIEKDLNYMTHCFLNKDVMGLLENIHCDQKYPENQNVRIKSTKRELMETYVDGRWIVSDQEETLDELLNKGYRILNFFSYRNKDHILNECEDGENEYHEMREWLEDLYSNNKVRKPLKRKLLILFMNNKALFLEKTMDDSKMINGNDPDLNTITKGTSNTDSDLSDIDEMPLDEASKYFMGIIPPRFQRQDS